LTADQALSFRDLLEAQRDQKAVFIFGFVSSSFEPSQGRSTVKFQCARLSKRMAGEVARLIREEKAELKIEVWR
jgi:hypothetical protein